MPRWAAKGPSWGTGRSTTAERSSSITAGAGFSVFMALLIPPYVTQATGSASAAGVVMAIISLAAVLGPVLGGLADKYRAHRLVLSLGVALFV